MKPLFVLVLVLVAVGALFFVISGLEGDKPSGTIAPGPALESGPAAPTGGGTAAVQPGGPERAVADPRTAPASEQRTELRGDGFANRLVGRVQDEAGGPIADAKVTLTRAAGLTMMFVNSDQDRSGDRTVTTRKDGGFVFENVEPYAHYSLEVDHPDYSRAEVNEVDVPLEGERQEPPITLRSGAQLTGFVRDTTGVGIAGAVVSLDRLIFPTQGQPSPVFQSATTDELGRYEIKNISAGNRGMRVEADGFAIAIVNGLSFQQVDRIERDVTLEVAERICGIVVGPGNTPVANAEVLAVSYSNSNQQCQEMTYSGEDGRFCLERLAPGKYTVATRAPGYRAGRSNRADTGEANLVIEMEPQATVRGTVVDGESGQPLTNFTVTLRTTYDGNEATAKTDIKQKVENGNGDFELLGVDPGTYVVEGDAPGYAPTFSDPFTVVRGQAVAGIRVRMGRGGAISGTVVDSSGAPVRGAMVETFNNDWTGSEFDIALGDMLPGNATRRQGRTGDDGSFTITALTPETYQLRVQAPGHCEHIQTDVRVLAGQDTKLGEVSLIQGGSVNGLVYDAAGKPVQGATVMLRVNGRTAGFARFYQTRTNAEGRYSLDGVQPGNYRLMATPPQGRAGADFLSEVTSTRSSEQPVAITDGRSLTVELKLGG